MNKLKSVALAAAVLAGGIGLSACSSDADTVSHNLSKDAEQFKVQRRIVFFNGITDKYLLEVQGLCSVETGDALLSGSLEVTCKTGDDAYKKHFLGLSDNVSFFVEQLESKNVSRFHYKVIFKPEAIIPDIDIFTSNEG